MSSNKKYWKSVEELQENSSVVETLRQNEFVEEIPTEEFLGDKGSLENSETSRRDFLKYVGFSTAAATLAACEGPVIKSIPYVVQPERIVPGVSNYYATTIANGFDFASVLIRTREGRPVKVENNQMAVTNGGGSARVHASVLSLYDNTRLKNPKANGKDVSWEEFDTEIGAKLRSLGGKELVILTQTFASPSTARLLNEVKNTYPNTKQVIYDVISNSEALDAYEAVYGIRGLADYDFSKASTIVGVGADFLGDWQGGGYDAQYAKGRIPKDGKMSRHVQFESNMSLTGANADKRVPVTPSEQKAVLAALYAYVTGGGSNATLDSKLNNIVIATAKELNSAGRNALLVCGIPDYDAQLIALEINRALGSAAFNQSTPRLTSQGDSKKMATLVRDMNAGRVGGILIMGVNPLYSLADKKGFAEGLKKVPVSISFSMHEDATAKSCAYVATVPHYLESWGDTEIRKGNFSISQPTIRPLFDTRQFQDTLLKWIGKEKTYYDYIKEFWTSKLGTSGWNKAVQDGVFTSNFQNNSTTVQASEDNAVVDGDLTNTNGTTESNPDDVIVSTPSVNYRTSSANLGRAKKEGNGLEMTLYTKTSLGNGEQAGNPWLQEMPDPITRISWDNYITVSRADAARLELKNYHVANGGLNGSYVNIKGADGVVIEKVPVIIQPGQAKGSVGLSLGYGKRVARD